MIENNLDMHMIINHICLQTRLNIYEKNYANPKKTK